MEGLGEYLFWGFVQATGAPERRGKIRRKLVVPGVTAQFAAENVVLVGYGLAAADRELALRAAAHSMTDKTRNGVEAMLKKNLSHAEDSVAAAADVFSWAAIARPVMGYFYERETEIGLLQSDRARLLMTSACLFGVGWGLHHATELPQDFGALSAYQASRAEPLVWTSLDDFYANCVQLTQDWATDNGPLPKI